MKIKDIVLSNEYRTNLKQNYSTHKLKSMNNTKNFICKKNNDFSSKQNNNNQDKIDNNINDVKLSKTNIKNSLNQFPLLDQIKKSWKFLSTLIFDSFYEILSYINKDTSSKDIQKISFFIQNIFKEHYEYTKNLLKTKIFNIMKFFGLSIKSESQVKSFTEKISPLFKFYFHNCFQWKNTDTQNFINYLKKSVKSIEYEDLLNKIIIDNNKNNINTMFSVSYEICNFMMFNDELLTYETQNENYILKYEKEKMINIDGFIQKNDDCLLLLNSPMIRKKYTFYKLLPIVYYLNNNNSTVTKSSRSTINKSIHNENIEKINNKNERAKIISENLNSINIFNKNKDSISKKNKNKNKKNNKKKQSAKNYTNYRKSVRLLSPALVSGHKTFLLTARTNKNIPTNNFLLSQSNNNINVVPNVNSYNTDVSLFNQSNGNTIKKFGYKNTNVIFNLKNNNSNFLKILFKKNNENKNFVLANSSKNNFCSSKSSKRTLNWNTSKKNVTIQGKKLFHDPISYQNLNSFLLKRYHFSNKSKNKFSSPNYNNKNESKNLGNSKKKMNNSIQTEYGEFKNFRSFKNC